jgi:hypothetical protein
LITVRNDSKGLLVAAVVPVVLSVALVAYWRPGYFTSEIYLAGLIGVELTALALWKFRQVFFGLLMYVFLAAGSGLPGNSFTTKARWAFLGIGALVGVLITLKERHFRLGLFHMVSFSCALAALASAAVSRYPDVALLKALSLFLLFLYAASGARIAVEGREAHFLKGLVVGCEILVGVITAFYAAGIQVMGNPNSLGAVMGVVAVPVLLWGMLVAKETSIRRRRMALLALSIYLVYYSHARAGILAAAVSCAFLCLGLREYKMLIKGFGLVAIMVTAAAILQPEKVSNSVSIFTSDVVYKGHGEGVFDSRQSPWNEAMGTINSHFWFGTGFGTKDLALWGTVSTANFTSNSVAVEYGSSYLAIVAWVGVIGTLPFALLIAMVLGSVVGTFRWLRATRSAHHPAVPLALVVVAGLVHAGFEDWMFAVGYYLCVFFWSMAFVLVDIAPAAPRVSLSSFTSRFHPLPAARQVFVSGRG